jgi:Ca-activated chloride channel family protein
MRVPVLTALLAIATLSAQDPPPLTTFRLDTRLVVLNVSVFDKDGKIVRGIPQSAFTVYEDGVRQEIKVFRQEDVPVSLGLVIDNSASMRPKRDRVAKAALAMVRASHPDDEVFVINFNEDAVIAQDFTSDAAKLEAGLRKIDAKGETAMRDALRLGIEHERRRGKKDKKVILVVTDGDDNSSVMTQEALVRVAQQNDVIIYGIGLLGGEEPRSAERAKKSLDELTLATGGRAWFPADVAEMEKLTPEIAHEIRNQYIVGYTPVNEAADGTYRKLKVEVNVPGVTVRTRSGYYAPRR